MTTDVSRQSAFLSQFATDLNVTTQSSYIVLGIADLGVTTHSAFVVILPGTRLNVSEQAAYIPIFSLDPFGSLKQRRILNINIG